MAAAMKDEKVYVELADGIPIRIFKNIKFAIASRVDYAPWLYADAVEKIRRAVFIRADYKCEHCGKPTPWAGSIFVRGHLHERIWRGRGGEQSVANGVCICYSCHMNSETAGHGKRKPQWGSRGLL